MPHKTANSVILLCYKHGPVLLYKDQIIDHKNLINLIKHFRTKIKLDALRLVLGLVDQTFTSQRRPWSATLRLQAPWTPSEMLALGFQLAF